MKQKQKQTVVGADPFADKLVHLIKSAIHVQTTQKNMPMYKNKISKWIPEEDELAGHPVVFLFPTLP